MPLGFASGLDFASFRKLVKPACAGRGLTAMAEEFLSMYEASYIAPVEGKILKKDVA